MSMIPGMGGDDRDARARSTPSRTSAAWAGIIDSMTPDERRNPSKIVDQSRRRRIAAGAGVEPHEVNELVKQFDAMADMMKKMAGMPLMERMRTMQQLGSSGMLNPGAKLAKQKKGTGKRLTLAGEGQACGRNPREKRSARRKTRDAKRQTVERQCDNP